MAEEIRTVNDGDVRTVASIESTDWKQGYVTRQYVKQVLAKIAELETAIGRGRHLVKDDAEATLGNIAYEIGRIKGLNDSLDIAESITL